MITSEELDRMMVEIGTGIPWGDPRTRIPQTEEHRLKWERIAEQMRDIQRRGRTVEIPGEIPDLNTYIPGTV
jgi:hypothetical protein